VEDIYGLTSATNYEKALSMIFKCETIEHLSQGFKSSMHNVRLTIPVGNNYDSVIGTGIGVDCSNVADSGDVVFSRSDVFYRYIANNSSNSHLSIRINKDTNTIEATFMVFEGTLFQYALLVFSHDAFLEAFSVDANNYNYINTGVNSTNFDVKKINAALIQSIVGGVHHKERPRLLYAANERYPYAIADNLGEHFFKSVFCSYAGGQPMMSIHVFVYGTWSFDYSATALRKMQNWGITERNACKYHHRVEISVRRQLWANFWLRLRQIVRIKAIIAEDGNKITRLFKKKRMIQST